MGIGHGGIRIPAKQDDKKPAQKYKEGGTRRMGNFQFVSTGYKLPAVPETDRGFPGQYKHRTSDREDDPARDRIDLFEIHAKNYRIAAYQPNSRAIGEPNWPFFRIFFVNEVLTPLRPLNQPVIRNPMVDPGYPVPQNEKRRLRALYDYQILDTIPEKEYDFITRMAAQICNTPASLMTLLSEDRQWFKSTFGYQITETPRAISFCNYSILDPDHVTVVPDMRVDERFAANPLVTQDPYAVFYAGAPLVTPDGFALGTICVLDREANNLNEEQQEALQALANQIVTNLELRKKIYQLTQTKGKLKEANKELKHFARITSHDMKTPLANILMLSSSYRAYDGSTKDDHPMELIKVIDASAREMLSFIDHVLERSGSADLEKKEAKMIDSRAVLHKVIQFIAPPADIRIATTGKFPGVSMDAVLLQQVFQNLITNAIKYNDKQEGLIGIEARSDAKFNHFIFTDNGSGIKKDDLPRLFKGKTKPEKRDRYGNTGTGHGLVTLKQIISKAGGKIAVTSELHRGSTFTVSLPV
jgi:signal transduction histidine kinase